MIALTIQLPRSWVVCERGDRWYRAVCRFLPSESSEPSEPKRIERVPYDAAHLVASIAKAKQGNVIVVWEIFADNAEEMARLDLIAALRADGLRSIQLAWMPANASVNARLAAQEAGVHFLLDDLASLQKIARMWSGTLSPLG